MNLPTGDIQPDLGELLTQRMSERPLALHEAVRELLVEVQDVDSHLNAEHTESAAALQAGIAQYRANETAIGGPDQFNSLLDDETEGQS